MPKDMYKDNPGHDMKDDPKEKEPKKQKADASKEWKHLQDARNYKTSNNLYHQARINEEFYTGDQWKGVNSKNLKQTTYNFVGQTTDVKVSSILANELTIQRKADILDQGNDKVQKAVKAFQLSDAKNWERLKMDNMNEQLVLDGAIQGIGVSYWYWDDALKTGNEFAQVGDIAGQLVDMIDLYVANPNEVDVQKQIWNKITVRMTVKELRDLAKSKGVPENQLEYIKADEQDITYSAFEKTDYEQDNVATEGKLATLLVNFERRKDSIWVSLTSKNIVIEDWKDTELSLYPIAVFTYKPRKRFIYGEAEMTRYIENQKVVNIQQAARHFHALTLAIPKVLFNKNMINSWSNAIGSVNPVNVDPQTQIGNAMQFVQPTAMSIDVDKSVQEGIERTQNLNGVNQNLLGAARPENAAALLTQIKQSNVPIESYRRRLNDYLEDVALIWEDFYKTKYNVTRRVVDEETGEVIDFTGTDFADVDFSTVIDVGASTQWSEITSTQALYDLWDRGVIKNPNQLIERLPDNIIKDQAGLVEAGEDEALLQQFMQIFMQTQPPEMQQQFAQLPPEEQKAFIKDMLGGAMQ